MLVFGILAVVNAFVKFLRPKVIYPPDAKLTPTDLTGMCYLPLVVWGLVILAPNLSDWKEDECPKQMYFTGLMCTGIPTIIISGMFLHFLFVSATKGDDLENNDGDASLV